MARNRRGWRASAGRLLVPVAITTLSFAVFDAAPVAAQDAERLEELTTGWSTTAADDAISLAELTSPADDLEPAVGYITGGSAAGADEFPWATFLLIERAGPSYFECGGTLVDPSWVLTAAHCAKDATAIAAITGRTTRPTSLSDPDFVFASGFAVHPGFTTWAAGLSDDVALVQLASPVSGPVVSLAAASDARFHPADTLATVAGWGITSPGGSTPSSLQKATMPIRSAVECGAVWPFYVAEDNVCAGYSSGEAAVPAGACQGDSGGPLLVPTDDPRGRIQIGTVSYGPVGGCIGFDQPVVYMRTSYYRDWIESYVGALPGPPVTLTPSAFVSAGPQRVMDTRTGIAVSAGLRRPGSSLNLKIAGVNGVPPNATAVVLNTTITESVERGYVQVYPTGRATAGSSSNINVPGAGTTISNTVIVPIGDRGRITFHVDAGGHVLADLFGYFVPSTASAGGRFVALAAPERTLDTRSPLKVPIGNPGDVRDCGDFATWNAANRWFWTYRRHGDPAKLDRNDDGVPCEGLAGNPGRVVVPPDLFKLGDTDRYRLPVTTASAPAGGVVPPEASAVVINVTATAARSPGFLHLYASPNGVVPGSSSNVNYGPGVTAPNLAIVPIGPDGAIELYALSGVHVVVDVVGWFTGSASAVDDAGLFVPLTPDRLVDTRLLGGSLAANTLQTRNVAALAGVPAADAAAMFLNVTLVQSAGPGFVQVFPAGRASPGSSSTVNVSTAGATRANSSITGLVGGKVGVFHSAGGHYLLDAAGYFTTGTP